MSENGNAPTAFSEVLASVVVFLVALPLCMGIAIASGVPPAMGLVSGIIGGLVVGYFAGSPLQVSGPAAGLAVIVFEIVHTHGIEALGPILMLAGLIQVVAGKLHLGQWFRAVAPAVIYAMLAGIGVLIFASQFHVMVDDKPDSNGIVNLMTIPQAVVKGVMPVDGSPHHLAAAVGMLTLAVLVGWNWVRPKIGGPLRHMPAPLLAVSAGVAAAAAFNLPINYVAVPKNLGEFVNLPTVESISLLLRPEILAESLAVAAIASAEALLCAVAVDKLHEGERTDLDQELFAQGIGNTLAGLVGGLPITGVIVRSTANVESGGKTRWSAVMHGAWLLLAIAAVPFVLESIPVASLAAVLVYIGYKLVKPEVWSALLARGRSEFAIYVVTVVAIVATNLLEGLLVGVALSVLKLAWSFSHLEVDVEDTDARIDVRLRGSGTFVGLPKLAAALSGVPANREVHIHLEEVDYLDHACFELLSDWKKQYEGAESSVVVEWETLARRGTYRPREAGEVAA
ncbi:MAG: SulP family inorganic anion transporter [Deltaproteobacteria bacterium]|nr:MAG: SulP family inorganic anion transporter [Deltaproteobacteria bacterium]